LIVIAAWIAIENNLTVQKRKLQRKSILPIYRVASFGSYENRFIINFWRAILMKFQLMPNIDYIPATEQEATLFSLRHLIRNFISVPERKDDHSIQSQIDWTLDRLDINTLLDPNMPNTGGMEVMATIKRDLRLQLESLLFAQKN
ncbi:MAG: hypothetical protein ACU833_14105, partial [Gammaproteobacteria bacterium]